MPYLFPVNKAAALAGVLMLGTRLTAEVRPPAVAGSFYPGERTALEREVKEFLAAGAPAGEVVALIAPHAGYVFSGATAGKTFAALAGRSVSRVVLLGPSHHASFRGGALPPAGVTAFATPLGTLPLDRAAVETLRHTPLFDGPPSAHAPEHCLEVELPFLQAALGEVPIVPVLVGSATDAPTVQGLARGLSRVVGDGTVVVVSSDFTHHGSPYGYAPFAGERELGRRLVTIGRDTAERAAALDLRGFSRQIDVSGDTVCGARPISVLLALLSHAFAGSGRVVEVTTSGEVSGTWSQVVTYAGVVFSGRWQPWRDDPKEPQLGTLSSEEKTALLALARATLESHLVHDTSLARWFAAHPVTGNLAAKAGAFVTIHNRPEKARLEGRLRGCIGVIEAHEPLVDAVVHAAVSAAHDPRFPPLTREELPRVSLEISVLSPLRPVPDYDAIRLGIHGVLLTKGSRHALFLPQVATETGWDLPTFLSQLSLKAGLPPDAWRSGASFQVFTADVFGEPE
jgi:AmmeMemoRadiSam system protein B/AmmeMemoRadiSam system protein A